jgi:hypothetical protein
VASDHGGRGEDETSNFRHRHLEEVVMKRTHSVWIVGSKRKRKECKGDFSQ